MLTNISGLMRTADSVDCLSHTFRPRPLCTPGKALQCQSLWIPPSNSPARSRIFLIQINCQFLLGLTFISSIAEVWSYVTLYYICRFFVQMSSTNEHANKGPMVLGISILLCFLAIKAVTLRFLSRKLSKAQYWWDDWMILAALVSLQFYS